MKTLAKFMLIGIMSFVLLTNCDTKDNPVVSENLEETSLINAEDNVADMSLLAQENTAVIPGSISEKDIDNILYMLEEEKLANNVYVFFNEKYKRRVFENISKSEVIHQKAVTWLADLFKIEIPVKKPAGEFYNAELQKMYTELITNSTTLIDALKAGAYIEEHDIKDLKKAIEETENENVKRVLSNLMRASGYHLKAFVANLKFNKVTYQPQILTKEEFDAILSK